MQIYLTTKKNNILSYLVRWFTGSEVSHVGLVYEDLPIVLNAGLFGLKFSCLNKFIKSNVVIYIFELNNAPKEPFLDILKKLETPFDFPAIIGFIPVIFMKRFFNKDINNPFGKKNLLFCSEIVYLYFKKCIEAGILPMDFLEGYRRETFSPQSIIDLASKRCEYFEKIL